MSIKSKIRNIRPLFKSDDLNKFIDENINIALSLESGEYQKNIFNEDLFVIPQNVLLKSFEDTVYESHKKFYDIHYIIEGSEKMALLNINEINKPFEENLENDYFLYKSDLTFEELILCNNQFVVFDFSNVHKVGIKNDINIDNVKKIVIKIKKDFFEKEFIHE